MTYRNRIHKVEREMYEYEFDRGKNLTLSPLDDTARTGVDGLPTLVFQDITTPTCNSSPLNYKT